MLCSLRQLMQSSFRRRFRLSVEDAVYVERVGIETIRRHAVDFVSRRLAPSQPEHDGKQTPMRGHPIFKAQHACACCCRGCLEKWHGITQGRELSGEEIETIVDLLMRWISSQPIPENSSKRGNAASPHQGMFDF